MITIVLDDLLQYVHYTVIVGLYHIRNQSSLSKMMFPKIIQNVFFKNISSLYYQRKYQERVEHEMKIFFLTYFV